MKEEEMRWRRSFANNASSQAATTPTTRRDSTWRYMSSLNDHNAWEGNIEDGIALSIRDSGGPLVDLTRDDDKAGPSGVVKDEPADPCGKPPTDEDYNFF
jgi:hypothetical protein